MPEANLLVYVRDIDTSVETVRGDQGGNGTYKLTRHSSVGIV